MPYSIFFTNQGHAIHGSNATGKLGQPASHGCVRLSPAHAATLFALVKDQGLENTRVELAGRLPTRQELMAKLKGADDDARADEAQVAELPEDLRDGDLRDGDWREDELPRDLAAAPGFRAYRENGRTYYIRINPRVVRRVYRVFRRNFHFRW